MRNAFFNYFGLNFENINPVLQEVKENFQLSFTEPTQRPKPKAILSILSIFNSQGSELRRPGNYVNYWLAPWLTISFGTHPSCFGGLRRMGCVRKALEFQNGQARFFVGGAYWLGLLAAATEQLGTCPNLFLVISEPFLAI